MTAPSLRLPAFYRLVALDAIDSTNEEVRRLAAAGAPDGTLVWAREQTAGRGRRGRFWQSAPGNLFASLLLRPDCPPRIAAQLSFVAAVALGDGLDALLGQPGRVGFKWPNDVLLDRRKIAGILIEASAAADRRLDWLVIGVGVNVASAPAGTPYEAASLHAAGATHATAPAMLEAFAERLLDALALWRGRGFPAVRERWLARAVGIGEPVEVRLDRETLHGRFAALDDSGGLALDLADGPRRIVTAGDVFFPPAA